MEAVEGAPGNQLRYNGIGQLWLGVGMHEFARSPAWRERGLAHCGGYFLPSGAFYPDGSSRENSLGYTIDASSSGLEVLLLVNTNGWPCPAHTERAMLTRARFLADVRRPDGLCPHTGDGEQSSPDSYIEKMVDLGASPSLQHVVTNGESGPPPDHESSYYPWMGTGVMRSGWGTDANCLCVTWAPSATCTPTWASPEKEISAWSR